MNGRIARAALALLAPATLLGISAPAALGAGTADLAVKAHAKKQVKVGHNLQFRVVVRNLGPDPATNVVITTGVSDQVNLLSADCGSGTPLADGSCAVPSLAVGARVAVRFRFNLCCPFNQPDETLTSTVTLSADTTDPNPANSSSTCGLGPGFGVFSGCSVTRVLPPPAPTVIATIPLGLSPAWMAFDTRSGDLYVAEIFSDDVAVIDPRLDAVVDRIPLAGGNVCAHPFGVGYDPRRDVVYVACQQYTAVTAIDGRTNQPLGEPIDVGSSPFGIAFDRRNGDLYIAVAHEQDLAVLDGSTRSVIGRIAIPPVPGDSESEPFGIAYADRSGQLYVAQSASPRVSVVDGATNTVVAAITMPSTSRGVAYDRRTGDVYVANFEAGVVSVIDGTTNAVAAEIPVGRFPFGLAVNPRDGGIYVANFGSASVSVIDGATRRVTATLPLAAAPVGVAADPRTGKVYVTAGDAVAVIAPGPARPARGA